MLNLTELIGFAAIGQSSSNLIGEYAGGVISGVNSPPYSVNIDFATYTGDWVIVFALAGNTPPTTGSVSVNGVAATSLFVTGGHGFWYAPHPGAGTYAVSYTGDGGNNGCIGVWVITGTPISWTPFDTDTNEATGTIDCPLEGVIFAGGYDSNSSPDTFSVNSINSLNYSAQAGGDSASYFFGFKNGDTTIGTTNIPYAMSANGTRYIISIY